MHTGCAACVWDRMKKSGDITREDEPSMKQAFRDAYNAGVLEDSPMPDWFMRELRGTN